MRWHRSTPVSAVGGLLIGAAVGLALQLNFDRVSSDGYYLDRHIESEWYKVASASLVCIVVSVWIVVKGHKREAWAASFGFLASLLVILAWKLAVGRVIGANLWMIGWPMFAVPSVATLVVCLEIAQRMADGRSARLSTSHSAVGDGSVTFVESTSKLGRMSAISAGFALVCSLFLWMGGPEPEEASGLVVQTVMVLGLLLGVIGLIYFVPRLIGPPRVLLVLDESGFDDHASVMSAGRVQWTEVTELKLMRISRNDNIAARVTDPERLQRGRGSVGRLVAAINRRFADVWIAGSTLPVPAADVLEQMLDRWMLSTGGPPSRSTD